MSNLIQHTLREWKTLASLGGPILVTQLAQMANGVIDTVMAGRYGARDLAGVAIGNSFWMPILLFFIGVLTALQPTITLDPAVNLAHSEVCTLTVLANNVSDVDAFDPPDGMASIS